MTKINLPVDAYAITTSKGIEEEQFEGMAKITPACDELGLHLHIELETHYANMRLSPAELDDLIYHMQCASLAAKENKHYHPDN